MNNENLPDNPQIQVVKTTESGLFTNYIYKAIPLAFDESMSYYETLCGLLNYLKNVVIPTVNNNADAVAELQTLYEQLRTYVDNYFTNLDVQEEINNKLDEMTESGELTNLIKNYVDPIYQAYKEEINNNIENFENETTSAISNIQNTTTTRLNSQDTKINAIENGSPLVASSTSGMTDTTKVYVNTTDGYWYYYNGNSWQQGGIYQSTGLPSDTQNIINNALTYRGNIIDLGYTTFEACNENGYYNFGSAQVSSITDKPTDLNVGGILQSFKRSGGGVVYQFITDNNGNKWFRYGNQSFRQYSGEPTMNFIFRGIFNNLGYTSFSECNQSGIYQFASEDLPNITDKPSGLTTNGKLLVMRTTAGGVGVTQIIFAGTQNIWIRNNVNNPFRIIDNSYQGRITDLGYTTFAQCTEDGYYNFHSADLSNITDKPTELNYGGMLVVYSKAGGNANFRYIVDFYGNVWFKSSIQDWTQIYNANPTPEVSPINWCAMGDSISQGWYSYLDKNQQPASTVDANKGWVKKVKDITNWNLTNISMGGTGYLHVRDSSTHPGDKNGFTLARETDYSSYNLVTLSYGINDWKGNRPLGTVSDDSTNPTTVCGAMKATIEAIMASNPKCKIIVTLPLNAVGYSFNYGDKSTNYGLGYRFSNSGTLEEFVQKMIEVCNYYGVQYIDLSHYSVVNRENLRTLLIDGVHPSEDCHTLLSYELSKKITY